MTRKPLVIFDMDGVLVDVTGSYREVTRCSVMLYLQKVMKVQLKDGEFLSLSDVSAIKKSGGLNNDWDLTDTILNCYLSQAFPRIDETERVRLEQIRNSADEEIILRRLDSVLKRYDPSRLEMLLNPGNILTLYNQQTGKPFLPSPLLFNDNDVKSGNLSKRIFQEVYLGNHLFREIYGEKPIFYSDEGYIAYEKLIPSMAELDAMRLDNTLSIATGRPAVEAKYALECFHMQDHFTAVVSEDDVVEAEHDGSGTLRKPHPFSLNLCIARSGYSAGDRVYYVGDMPDDMEAAHRAEVIPVGFVNESSGESVQERERHRGFLKNRGAVAIFGGFQEILSFFNELRFKNESSKFDL
jgi:phosphoglycolate phosphatase-like HAD superfamily hydrolase